MLHIQHIYKYKFSRCLVARSYYYHRRRGRRRGGVENREKVVLKVLLSLFVAKLLGFDNYTPPFASASGNELLSGVNFASAAAGIREETGQQLVRIHFMIKLYILS